MLSTRRGAIVLTHRLQRSGRGRAGRLKHSRRVGCEAERTVVDGQEGMTPNAVAASQMTLGDGVVLRIGDHLSLLDLARANSKA